MTLLAGVEYALRQDPRVTEAVAVVQTDSLGERYLVAFVVLSDQKNLSSPQQPDAQIGTQIRRGLTDMLPEYMIPSYIEPIGEVPRTNTEKIDRKTLTSWTYVLGDFESDDGTKVGTGSRSSGTELRTATEEAVIGVFEDVLRRRHGTVTPDTK